MAVSCYVDDIQEAGLFFFLKKKSPSELFSSISLFYGTMHIFSSSRQLHRQKVESDTFWYSVFVPDSVVFTSQRETLGTFLSQRPRCFAWQ